MFQSEQTAYSIGEVFPSKGRVTRYDPVSSLTLPPLTAGFPGQEPVLNRHSAVNRKPADAEDKAALERVRSFRPSNLHSRTDLRYRKAIKPVVEAALVAPAMPFVLPVVKMLEWLSRSDGNGPGLFHQVRSFRAGTFLISKIRTMKQGDPDPKGKSAFITRPSSVTFMGKFLRPSHIDELPQLWQVVRTGWHTVRALLSSRADTYKLKRFLRQSALDHERPRRALALVGPRAVTQAHMQEFEKIDPRLAACRRSVPPGITGLSQISAPLENDTDLRQLKRLMHDVWYIDHQSLALDLAIIALTIPHVLSFSRLLPGRLLMKYWPDAIWRPDDGMVIDGRPKENGAAGSMSCAEKPCTDSYGQ